MIEMPPAEADRLTALYYGPSGNGPGSHRGDDACFIDWLYFDARDSKGTSLVDVVLRSSRLSRGERAFLTMMRGTAMCLYELVRPAPGIIKLREVFSREELLMNEEFLALSSRDTGLVLARIAPDSTNGWPEIVGPLFEFPSTLRGELVSRLKTAVDAFRAAHPQSPVIEAHKLSPLILRYQWRPAPPEPQPVPPSPSEALREAAELRLHERYADWADQPLDKLDGRTPRAAAGTPLLRSRVVELLHELDRAYERALELDEPACDPTVLWDNLDLREERDGPSEGYIPHGHDTMRMLLPGLADLAADLARRYRQEPGHDLERSIRDDRITQEPGVRKFLLDLDQELSLDGFGSGLSITGFSRLAAYIGLRVNWELHLRKVCRITEELSWMLGSTSLDGEYGADLRLPFGSVVFKFTDRYALGLAERLLARANLHLRGRRLRVLTVQVTQFQLTDKLRSLRVLFLCDALNGEPPTIVGRDLRLEPQARLVDILASEAPGVDAAELTPIFACSPMRHLLHLVMNMIIHMTSCRPPPEGERKQSRSGLRFEPTGGIHSEEVYDVPGTIDITMLRSIQQARRGAIAREQIHRCMVRGYRRRANPDWKDQSKRWIKPHWRGPSEASIVEREYRLIP